MKIEDEIKSKFRNDYHKAIVNLHYTNLLLSDYSNTLFKSFGISSQQYNILRILRGQHPETVSIGLIKERMLDKNSDVSRILTRLKIKDLIYLKKCDTDKRQKDVSINKKGLQLLKTIDNQEEGMENLLSSLSAKDVAKLNTILDTIRKSLRQ